MRKISLIYTTSAVFLLAICRAEASGEPVPLSKPGTHADGASILSEEAGLSDSSGSSHLPVVGEETQTKKRKRGRRAKKEDDKGIVEKAIIPPASDGVRTRSQRSQNKTRSCSCRRGRHCLPFCFSPSYRAHRLYRALSGGRGIDSCGSGREKKRTGILV